MRGGAALATANLAGAGIGFLQAVLVTRALGPGSYGQLAVVITFVTVAQRLLSFRTNEWLIRALGEAETAGEDGRRRAAQSVLASGRVEAQATLLAVALVMLLAGLAARHLAQDPALAGAIRIYAVIMLANCVTETATGVLQVAGRFRTQAAAATIERLLALGLIALVLWWGGGFQALVWAHAAGPVLGGMLLAVLAARALRERLGPGWWRGVPAAPIGGWRPALGFLVSSNASGTLSLVTRDADVLWLSWLRGPVETGWYKLAVGLAGLLMVPTAALAQAVYPETVRAVATRRLGELASLLRRSSAAAAAYVLPAAALVWIGGGPATRLVFGGEFERAAPALAALMVGMGFANILFWSRPALLGLGRPGAALLATAIAAAVKVAGVVIWVPSGGYVAAAWVLTATYAVGVGVSVMIVGATLRRA